MTNADKLRAMRDYIEEHGWTKHRLQNGEGEVCLLGAKNAVVWGDPYITPGQVTDKSENSQGSWELSDSIVLDLVRCINPDTEITTVEEAKTADANFIDIAEWNDQVAESKEQVIEMLDKCADKVEGVNK